MRPTACSTLLVFVVFVAGVHVNSVRAGGRASPQQKAVPAAVVTTPSWIVEGRWMSNQDDAIQSALEQAQSELVAHLRNQNPPIEWTPPPDFIRQNLLKDLEQPAEEAKTLRKSWCNGKAIVEEEKLFDGPLGKMRRVRLKVELDADKYGVIKRHETEYQKAQRELVSHQRQLTLARILAGVVVLLGTVVGYFRLEEMTKGYYTNLLRLAAVGAVAAVVVGLLMVF